jgi:hypothetical protein
MSFGRGVCLPAFSVPKGPGLSLNFLSGSLDPRITFSRTSNATLTGSDGLIQFAPNNALTGSIGLTTGWGLDGGVTLTPNATTAPDGTNTASFLARGAGTYIYAIPSTQAVGIYSYSLYLKMATAAEPRLVVGTDLFSATFNLNTLAITSISSGITASIEDVGNGWRRCNILFSLTLPNDFFAEVSMFGAVPAGQGYYVWGAQLSRGALQPYYPTTTAAYYGPRFDYDPVTLAPKGLLIEDTDPMHRGIGGIRRVLSSNHYLTQTHRHHTAQTLLLSLNQLLNQFLFLSHLKNQNQLQRP